MDVVSLYHFNNIINKRVKRHTNSNNNGPIRIKSLPKTSASVRFNCLSFSTRNKEASIYYKAAIRLYYNLL